MKVSTNTLLNILIPNENKTLKNVLKEADTNQLNSTLKSSSSVQTIIKNLFNDAVNHTKSNETIMNLLKNSSVFKDMGNFTSELKSLQNLVKENPSLSKFEAVIKDFLINIKNLDETSLKEQLGKSGIFLESKLNTSLKPNNLPNKIENILLQLKQELSNLKSPQSKELMNFIDKLLTTKNHTTESLEKDLKNLLINIKNLPELKGTQQIQQFVQLTNQLKSLTSELQLLKTSQQNIQVPQSNQTNQTQNVQQQDVKSNPIIKIKESLQNINNQLSTINSPKAQMLKQNIESILNQPNIQIKDLSNFIKDLSPKMQNFIINQPTNNTLKNIELQFNSLKVLAYNSEQAIKQEVIPNKTELIRPEQLKSNISSQSVLQNNLLPKLNEILTNIKTELLNSNFPISKDILNIIDKLLIKPDTNAANELLTKIKTLITNTPTQSNFQPAVVYNLLNQLENSIKPNSPLLQNLFQLNPQLQKEDISNDIKSTLLKIAEEVRPQNTQLAQDTYKQVDRLLTQVDYYQLMSLTSSSNYIYFPFIWDMLEDGSLSMKKLNEEKFYCEINLTLKEYGKINLLLVMYEKNHLDISIFAQKKILKEEVSNNLQKLKRGLSGAGIIPGNIKLLDLKEEDEVKEQFSYNNHNNQDLNFGINIKV